MKIKDLIKATIESYFKKSLERYPLITLDDYRRIEIEFDRRKYKLSQRLEFLTFVNRFDKSFIGVEKLLLESKDLDIMFEAYDQLEKETHTYDILPL